jgi:hypothetical protein
MLTPAHSANTHHAQTCLHRLCSAPPVHLAATMLGNNVQPAAEDLRDFERNPQQNMCMWHLTMGVDECNQPPLNCEEDEEMAYGERFIARYAVTDADKMRIAQQYKDYAGPKYGVCPTPEFSDWNRPTECFVYMFCTRNPLYDAKRLGMNVWHAGARSALAHRAAFDDRILAPSPTVRLTPSMSVGCWSCPRSSG